MTNKVLQSRYKQAVTLNRNDIIESYDHCCVNCGGTVNLIRLSSYMYQGSCCHCKVKTVPSTKNKIVRFLNDCIEYNRRKKDV